MSAHLDAQGADAAVVAEGAAHGVDIGLSIGTAPVLPDTHVVQVVSDADRRMYDNKRRAPDARAR